jgi:hypothetical protein
MNTFKLNAPIQWAGETTTATKQTVTFWDKYTSFTNGQAKNRTAWFMVSLLAQGVLFLPIPALLIYYFSAPVLIIVITLALFFANIIAGMGGSGIRTMITLFAVSIAVHVIMLATFII